VGAREHPSSTVTVLDRGSKHRTGATVSSRMAQSRYGSAGELLASAWRAIVTVRDTRALVDPVCSVPVGSHRDRASDKGVQRASLMRILTRFVNRRLRGKTLKWQFSRPQKEGLRNSGVIKDSKVVQTQGAGFCTSLWF
jgi:hypothetical protein